MRPAGRRLANRSLRPREGAGQPLRPDGIRRPLLRQTGLRRQEDENEVTTLFPRPPCYKFDNEKVVQLDFTPEIEVCTFE